MVPEMTWLSCLNGCGAWKATGDDENDEWCPWCHRDEVLWPGDR